MYILEFLGCHIYTFLSIFEPFCDFFKYFSSTSYLFYVIKIDSKYKSRVSFSKFAIFGSKNGPHCKSGGTSCCRHKYVLLDADQKQPDEFLTYHMKFRFWYQDYNPAMGKNLASHQNLVRFYWQTEHEAGEYDVPKAKVGTPPEKAIHEISTRWKVSSYFYY